MFSSFLLIYIKQDKTDIATIKDKNWQMKKKKKEKEKHYAFNFH